MKSRLTSVASNIIAQVRLLVIVILLLAISILIQVLWRSSQHDETNDLLINYHLASIRHIGAVRNEMLIVKSYLRDIEHQNSGVTHIELFRSGHEVIQSLHIVKEISGDIFSIQKRYQHPGFDVSVNQLQTQLAPFTNLLGDSVSATAMDVSMEVANINAVLLTLKQMNRLHTIEKGTLVEKTGKQGRDHTIAIFGFILITMLVGGFIIKRVFGSIGAILLNQKDAEEKLFQEKELLYTTLYSIGDAVITTDGAGLVAGMNPVAEQLTGWALDEAEGKTIKTIFSIINAETREPIENPIEKVMATGEIVYLSNHTTLIAKDGVEYQIADSAAPIRNNEGHMLGMVLVFNDVTEAYRLREKARAVQQQLQALFDGMQTMMVILDADGVVTLANNTPLKLAGLEQADVLGKKFWDCAWFTDLLEAQDHAQADFSRALAGHNTLRDIQIQSSGGLPWIELSIHPVLNEEGRVIQVVAEGRDISQRKKMEQDILSSSQHLKLYREQAPLATIEWNTDFQIVNWNRAAEKIFGYKLDEVKGRDFVDIMLPESSVVDVEKVWKALMAQTGGEISINENLTKDGRVILCEWHNTPLINESGTVIGAASIVLDVTAQQKAQRELQNKELEQREILNSMAVAVISFDEDGIIQTFNHSAEALFGCASSDIPGENIEQLIPEFFTGKGGGDMKVGSCEVKGRHKDKGLFPLRLSVAELSRGPEERKRFIGNCMDLTKIKQQQEQLRRSQKMEALGKLTGGIAHDFNNMLGIVTGYAELLEEALHGQEKLENYARQIHRAGERGTKLTKKLLSFSRQNISEAEVVDINTVLQGARNLLEKTLTARIKLVYELADDLWSTRIDISDLEDAILNMAINAMHAMEEVGQLTIRTFNESINEVDAGLIKLASGDYVLLSITDTGCGMDEATIEKIFDPFFTTKGEHGTGLGLSQVYGFVERSGGVLNVYSDLGHGSQFTLHLPRYHGVNVHDKDNKVSRNNGLSGKEKILIVDDEPTLLELTAEILHKHGYQVICAKSSDHALSDHALQVLETESIDLLLTDVIMPEMDGYQLATIVQEKYPTIKIQLASGFTDDRHASMIDNDLHQGLIHKPYRQETLLKRMRELLD